MGRFPQQHTFSPFYHIILFSLYFTYTYFKVTLPLDPYFNLYLLRKLLFLFYSAQVDTRILKAVAIEHSKDADAAAECILSEVLPFMTRQFSAHSSSHENPYSGDPLNEGGIT